jgi:hypothetical protein
LGSTGGCTCAFCARPCTADTSCRAGTGAAARAAARAALDGWHARRGSAAMDYAPISVAAASALRSRLISRTAARRSIRRLLADCRPRGRRALAGRHASRRPMNRRRARLCCPRQQLEGSVSAPRPREKATNSGFRHPAGADWQSLPRGSAARGLDGVPCDGGQTLCQRPERRPPGVDAEQTAPDAQSSGCALEAPPAAQPNNSSRSSSSMAGQSPVGRAPYVVCRPLWTFRPRAEAPRFAPRLVPQAKGQADCSLSAFPRRLHLFFPLEVSALGLGHGELAIGRSWVSASGRSHDGETVQGDNPRALSSVYPTSAPHSSQPKRTREASYSTTRPSLLPCLCAANPQPAISSSIRHRREHHTAHCRCSTRYFRRVRVSRECEAPAVRVD